MAPRSRKSASLKPKHSSGLGDFLRQRRLEKGFSQGDLARMMGYESPQYISDWERGYSSVPMKRLLELSKHLDVKAERLYELLLDFAMKRLEADMREQFEGFRAGKRRRA